MPMGNDSQGSCLEGCGIVLAIIAIAVAIAFKTGLY